ncbi:MAG: hypothetical protein D6775_05440 [Caldilineae bacterium]|nr:MAG: hypothetical protein D6775_05440 [Caldilineae bacterium]
MREIDQLLSLQDIDTDLDADRKRYAEIQEALKPPASLQAAQEARDQAAARVEHWRKERKRREAAVSDQVRKIREQEAMLYGGRIKDPREQVALQKNVEAMKRHLDTLEEAELEAIMELEEGEGQLAEAETALAEAQSQWEAVQQKLLEERVRLIAHARELKAQRETAAARLTAGLLQRYEELRQKKGGLAVARLRGGNCGGCGAALPTATRQQVYGDDLVTCPVCGRLLHE